MNVTHVDNFSSLLINQKTQNIDLSMWDFSSGINFDAMFQNNLKFNQNIEKRNIPFQNKNTSKLNMMLNCFSYNYPLINFKYFWNVDYEHTLWMQSDQTICHNWFVEFMEQYRNITTYYSVEKRDVENYINGNYDDIHPITLDDVTQLKFKYDKAITPIVMKHNLFINIHSELTHFGKRPYTLDVTKLKYKWQLPEYMFKNKSINEYTKKQIYLWLQTQTLFCSGKEYEIWSFN